MLFDFSVVWAYKEVFISGLTVTLLLTVASALLGTALGFLLAFGKLSKSRLVNGLASVYIDFFRVAPVLVMLIWAYYVLPILFGIRLDAFSTSVLVLALFLSAYVAEVIRAGVLAIPKGQVESALTLGLSRFQAMKRIVLPQVVRQMMPPLTGLYIEQLKYSSLTAIIAVNELLHSGQILISQTFRPLEIYTTIAVIYIGVLWSLATVTKRFELGGKRTKRMI